MRKFLILLFLGASFWSIMAEKTKSPDVYDEIIIESVNKCVVDEVVNVTGGYIGLQETKDNGDKFTHIALPDSVGYYEITASLSPIMRDLEKYYSVVKPWKLVDGCLCSINVEKNHKEKLLIFIYHPQNRDLVIYESKVDNKPHIMPSKTPFSIIYDFVTWGAVAETGGFIREEYDDGMYKQVAVKLQPKTTVSSLISDLKPFYNYLEQIYYCGQPWKIGEDGVLECKFFVESEKLLIHFYYVRETQILVINFYRDSNK
ncbi:MAG: hypothetical protein IKV83_03410 [Muribaculaceae bacterium]|nr:hypothetical protein [Muribaculaceae bacterium]